MVPSRSAARASTAVATYVSHSRLVLVIDWALTQQPPACSLRRLGRRTDPGPVKPWLSVIEQAYDRRKG